MKTEQKIKRVQNLTKAIFLLTLAETIACGILVLGSIQKKTDCKHSHSLTNVKGLGSNPN